MTVSDPSKPAQGRLDPIRMTPLLTVDTKTAVANCKDKAQHLSDPMPLQDMYDMMLPNPNSTHQLTEFLSKRGESKPEAFHDRLAHFANCGMRNRLAHNLKLAGTARFNIAIRQKRSLLTTANPTSQNRLLVDRKSMPASWEKIVPHFNHSELWHANNLAKSVGCPYPFPKAEILPEDNGERFFSQHMMTLKDMGHKQRGANGECLCQLCQKPVDACSGGEATHGQTQQQGSFNGSETVNNNTPKPPPPPATTTTPQHRGKIPNGVAHRVGACTSASITTQPTTPYQFNSALLAPHVSHTMTLQLPVWCFPPMFSTTIVPCCWQHKEWLTRRVGRPPYHPLCHER